MHKRFLARCLVAWMMAWLPLAGVLAATMPIPDLARMDVAMLTPAAESTYTLMPCHQAADDENAAGGTCSQCLVCHIAGAVVPSLPAVMPMSIQLDEKRSIDVISFTSFIPELPPRPPAPARA